VCAGVNRRLIRRGLCSGLWLVCGATLSVTDGLLCASEERSRGVPCGCVCGCLWVPVGVAVRCVSVDCYGAKQGRVWGACCDEKEDWWPYLYRIWCCL